MSDKISGIINSMGDGVCITDTHDNCIFINNAALALLGYDRNQCIGKNIWQLLQHGEHKKNCKDRSMHGGCNSQYAVFVKSDGTQFDARYTAKPFTEDGKITGTVISFTDVTEIVRENDNLHALVNGTQDLTWSIDKNYRIIIANRPFRQMVKAITQINPKEGDLVFLKEFGEELNNRWKTDYDRALQGEQFTITETVFNPQTQQTEYGRITFDPLYDADGQLYGVACHRKDITNETTYLADLERTKADLNKIIDASPDIICSMDENGRFLQVSNAAFNILGYHPRELVGQKYASLIHPGDHRITQNATAKIRAGASFTNFENRYVHKDGRSVPLAWSIRWDNEAKIMHCIARDATEKKLAEKQVELSEQRFKRLVQDGSDLIGILDQEANYIYVSPTSLPILGYEPEELIGRNATEFVHPADVEIAFTQFANLQKGKQLKLLPFRFKHKNGSWRWMDTIVTNLTDDPAVNGIVANSRDVTEWRKAEDELKDLAQKLNTATKIARLGYWQLEPDGSNRYWSDEIYNIWGVSKQSFQLSYDSFIQTIHPDDRKKFSDAQNAAIINHDDIDLEYRIILPDGTNKWIYEKGGVVAGEMENKRIIRGTVQDITRQKLLSLSLQKTNQRYKYVTKATFDAVWDWDLLKDTLYWADGYKAIFGHDVQGLQPISSWTDNIHPDDLASVKEGIYSVIEGAGTNWFDEYRYQKANGTYAYVADRGFVIRNDAGAAVRMVGAMQDITKTKIHEVELEASNQRFALAAKATAEAIWEWNAGEPDTFKEYGYDDLFGYHLLGHKANVDFWASKVHPEDYPKLWETMMAIRNNPAQNGWTVEYRFLNATNEYINIKENAILLRNQHGELVRMVGSMQDVTVQKAEEQQLKLFADDLFKRNKELQQFGYIVSHNLRAPVANIIGITNLLELEKDDPAIIEKCSGDLKTMVNKLDDVIKDLSKILSITDGSVELTKDYVNLHEILNNVVSDLDQAIQNSGAKINKPKKSCHIFSHKAYLYSIFYNLISNAIKYRSEAAPEIVINTHGSAGLINITVADNGIGIDTKKHADELFKPYRRFNTGAEGKGLGLFLVKSHIEALKGDIHIESTPGGGTTFIITLPAA